MKQSLYFLLAMMLVSNVAKAQVEIRESDGPTPYGNDISGTLLEYNARENQSFSLTYIVTNVSGAAHTYKVTRVRLQHVNAWDESICWGSPYDANNGHCYFPNQINSLSFTTPDAQTADNNKNAELIVGLIVHGYGTSRYRYYVAQDADNNIVDSFDLKFVYEAAPTPVNTVAKEDMALTVYPNPAMNEIQVKHDVLNTPTKLLLTDVMGRAVMHQDMKTTTAKLDVSTLPNGIYFIKWLDTTGDVWQIKQVVIQH